MTNPKHPHGVGGDSINHWPITRVPVGSPRPVGWIVSDRCDLIAKPFGPYKTYRAAQTRRKAMIGGTTYNRARGLPA
jgi:hypothetical protein